MMKKENFYKILYGVAGILFAAFVLGVIAESLNYNAAENSAPLSLFILEKAACLAVPGCIVLAAGRIAKKKFHA